MNGSTTSNVYELSARGLCPVARVIPKTRYLEDGTMPFAKTIATSFVAMLVGVSFGQSPAPPNEATKLESLHEERIDVYSQLLKVAQAKGGSGREQYRKLLLVKLDAAKTPLERIAVAQQLLEWSLEYERILQTTAPDRIEALLQAKAERIEAELLVEKLNAGT